MKATPTLLLASLVSFATATFAEPAAGQPLTVDLGKGVKLELVWVAPGEFDMGATNDGDDAKPVHHVKLTKGFWMGKYEVTQEQYEAVTGRNPSGYKAARSPVENVNWFDAVAFTVALNGMGILPAGVACRLPTEAEWEYACRAGTTTRFYSGNSESDLARIGWYGASRVLLYGGNAGKRPHAVGEKEPNKLGFYDMIGNVWEWCSDWYGPYHGGGAVDPTGPATGSKRVRRGGAFPNAQGFLGSAPRGASAPTDKVSAFGFRVVCGPPQ
ncbi:MAG: formylglycine-generating enzyme family protein [Verrucomicrobia bacterium]|nr:formylglycine-generating enzyme family protein [Verrucomicrobiota bacterium]